jgi:RNA recognition motif-containing protein
MTTVFAYNLSYQLSADELAEAFEKYGHIKYVRILTDGHGRFRRSRGCGFVEFTHPNEADAALRDPESMILRDREVYVDIGRETVSVSVPKLDTIWVANIPAGVTRQRLMRFFASFRPIDARIIHTNEITSRKCFGYVKFGTQAIRDAAIERMNGQKFDGESIVVTAARRSFDECG